MVMQKLSRTGLIRQLREMYDADSALIKAWPKLAKLAHDPDLKKLCREGLPYTQERLDRLHDAFASLDLTPTKKVSPGMRSLIKTTLGDSRRSNQRNIRDAIIISGVKQISHYGAAGYSSSLAHSRALGLRPISRLLKTSVKEKAEAIAEEESLERKIVMAKE